MDIKVPEHITDKEEIAAWIADQEEQAAMVAKIKAEAAAKNDAVTTPIPLVMFSTSKLNIMILLLLHHATDSKTSNEELFYLLLCHMSDVNEMLLYALDHLV